MITSNPHTKATKKAMPYALGENSVTILDGNKPMVITNDRANYHAVVQGIKEGDWDLVADSLNETQQLVRLTHGRVSVDGDELKFDGEVIHNNAAKKLTDLIKQGHTDVDRWVKFLEKLLANPSYNSREQAYNFISQQGMPLTESGNIIGYKGVRDDYKDKYSGNFDNSVGQTHTMQRINVDDNPNNGCSSGFHVGSHDYADNWACSDGRLMIVEYSPTDIVSVPEEYGYGKLRVCKYTVIGESESRQVLDNGAYGYSDDKAGDIWQYLCDYHDDSESVWYNSILQQFPSTSLMEILDAIRIYSDHFPQVTFDENTNDWEIKLIEIPVTHEPWTKSI